MDECTSNINITCDMLIQIIRNLIILSNISTNISTAAVSSLLNEPNPAANGATSSTHSNGDDRSKYFNLSSEQYHLYHPLYSNNQLNHYKTRNKSLSSSIGEPNSSDLEKSSPRNKQK